MTPDLTDATLHWTAPIVARRLRHGRDGRVAKTWRSGNLRRANGAFRPTHWPSVPTAPWGGSSICRASIGV